MTEWLIDKSAYARLAASTDASDWISRIERGLVRLTMISRLELGYSSRSGTELRNELKEPPLALMPIEYLTPAIEDRAFEVLVQLADRGHHRAPSLADLLVAAAAEISKLTVLHVDKDFELIAQVTGQPIERLNLHLEH